MSGNGMAVLTIVSWAPFCFDSNKSIKKCNSIMSSRTSCASASSIDSEPPCRRSPSSAENARSHAAIRSHVARETGRGLRWRWYLGVVACRSRRSWSCMSDPRSGRARGDPHGGGGRLTVPFWCARSLPGRPIAWSFVETGSAACGRPSRKSAQR